MNIYVEYGQAATIQQLVRILRGKKIPMNDMEVNRIADGEDKFHYGTILTIRGSQHEIEENVIRRFQDIEDVTVVEEL